MRTAARWNRQPTQASVLLKTDRCRWVAGNFARRACTPLFLTALPLGGLSMRRLSSTAVCYESHTGLCPSGRLDAVHWLEALLVAEANPPPFVQPTVKKAAVKKQPIALLEHVSVQCKSHGWLWDRLLGGAWGNQEGRIACIIHRVPCQMQLSTKTTCKSCKTTPVTLISTVTKKMNRRLHDGFVKGRDRKN